MLGKDSASSMTLISEHTEIEGDIKIKGTLTIVGRVKGNVIAVGSDKIKVDVQQNGVVEGEIRAPNVMINGTVIGDVHSTGQVTLQANSTIKGDVYYSIMEMSMGAKVNGSLVYNGEDSTKKKGMFGSRQPVAEVTVESDKLEPKEKLDLAKQK